MEAEKEIPAWMLILGAFYLVLIIASIPALIYIDPISRTNAVSAALSIIMLSLRGYPIWLIERLM